MNHSTRKIVAGLLSIAMVLTLVVGLAVTASAQSMTYTFTRNLTVGSRGADVTQLQTVLNAAGFLSVSPTGYFGPLTRAAVAAWQASVGLPSTGYFGPLSRAAIGGSSTVTPPAMGCPAGYTCTPVGGTTGGTLDNTDGSITATQSSLVATGAQLKKGETKDVIAVEFQATAGKVAVTRFDVRFDKRPWLYFSQVQLKSANGTVLATKNITGASDFTEITAGSDYLLRFEGLNLVVSPSQKETVVVGGTVLASTDKLSSNVSVTVSVPSGSIRTVNGKGYTDSLGGSITSTITLLSTGSNGNAVARLNASSPSARTVTTSTSGETKDVVLGIYDAKSENQNSTLNTVNFTIQNSSNGATSTASLFTTLKLTDGVNTYATSSASSTSVTFEDLNISLPQDQWKTLTLKGDVRDQDDFQAGLMASSTLTSLQGYDANYNTVNNTVSITGNNVTFLKAGASITNISSSATALDNGSSAADKAQIKFVFTLNNNSSSDTLYVSSTPATALATSTNLSASSTLTSVLTSPATVAGDASGYYAIPAGTSRTFTYEGIVSNTGNSTGLVTTQITKVYYDDDTTGLQEFNIDFGLENLRVSVAI